MKSFYSLILDFIFILSIKSIKNDKSFFKKFGRKKNNVCLEIYWLWKNWKISGNSLKKSIKTKSYNNWLINYIAKYKWK